jgi:tetratricopeptide (TPR) repeat protein
MNPLGPRSWLAVAVLVAMLVPAVFSAELSDKERDRRIQEARRLVTLGDREAAILKIEGLYEQDPDDPVVVKEFFSVLDGAGEYARAEQMIKAYLGRRPHDMRAMSDLASLYFKTGRAAEGRETIDRIVSEAPDERWPYDLGVDVLSRHKMEGELLELIGEARRALADSTVFAMNAAKIHMDAGRYDKATREYLLAASSQGRSHTASSACILGMAGDDEARPKVITSLEAAGSVGAFAETVRKTLWEVYLMDGRCAQSLAELAALIEDDKSFSKALPDLARRAVDAGCYKECAEAYALAATYSEDRSRVPSLLFEKGTCELKGGSADLALETYGGIVEKYRDTEWGSKASIARGRIYRRLGDPEAALKEADIAMAARHAGDERYAAILLKADCFVALGRLDEGSETYDLVEIDWAPAYAQEAFFNLGEINLYEGDFEGAASYYNVTLRQFPDQPRANDAIDRLLLLKASTSGDADNPDLKEFAAATLLKRQGKTAEARLRFEQLASRAQEGIKVESLKSLSEAYIEEGAFDSAVRTYKLIGESLNTYFSPSALEAIGDIYHELGRTDEAISAYENVILRFPESVSAGEARRKIELVRRGDSESS